MQNVDEEQNSSDASVESPRPALASKSLQQLGLEIRKINAANGWAVTQAAEFGDK